MDKTVTVIVELQRWVNKYQMWHTYLRKYMAHDKFNTCNIGDVVKVEQLPCKLSRRKAFHIVEILQREKIVLDGDTDRQQQSLPADGTLFRKQPEWAGLAPSTAEALARVRKQYQDYYKVEPTAVAIAERAAATRSLTDQQVSMARQGDG